MSSLAPTTNWLSLERSAMRHRALLFVAMVAALAIIGVTLYLDARREGAAALADFTREQVALADAVASAGASGKIEEPGSLVVVERGSDGVFRRPNGTRVDSAPLASATERGARTVTLTRPEAGAIGLPMRMAVAGISRTEDGRVVMVVATALRVRDRELRAQERLLLGMLLASLLVLGFGGMALRIQKREVLLARQKRHEDRLARADKLATMGAFATGIAHEIATPLGVIAARTEMLAARSGDDRSKQAAQIVLEQTEKIRGIITSFLAVARGEPTALVRIAPRDVLREAERMVEHRFAAAGVELGIEAADVPSVVGEPRLLEQAVVNLLLNACDASKPGQHVDARVSLRGERVCFSVEDEGSGIAPDVAARATEPFFTTKPAGSGTGLGLAIANEIAKHHQGRFVIGPRPERGTEARLELPIAGEAA